MICLKLATSWLLPCRRCRDTTWLWCRHLLLWKKNNASVPRTWNPGTNYADTRYQLPQIDKLTVEAARHRGLHVLGLIGGSLPAQPDLATRLNVEEMPQVTGVPLLGCLPAGVGQLSREEFADRTSTIDADVMIQLFGTP